MQRQQRGSAVDEGENVRQDGFALQSQRRLCFRFVYNSSPCCRLEVAFTAPCVHTSILSFLCPSHWWSERTGGWNNALCYKIQLQGSYLTPNVRVTVLL